MVPPIEITVRRISEDKKALIILTGPQDEREDYEFSLVWSDDEDWQAVFWALELHTQNRSTWPQIPEIIRKAEELGLFSNGEPSGQRLKNIGCKLYETVFGSEAIRNLFSHLLKPSKPEIPIIQLRLQDKGSVLQTYPWELLHDGEDFLFDCRRALLVRHIDSDLAVNKLALKEPVKVLLLDPRPTMPPQSQYRELPLQDRLYLENLSERSQGKLVVKDLSMIVPPKLPTLRKLSKYFIRFPNDTHILHIDAHGDFGWLCQQGQCHTLNAPNSNRCQICGAVQPEGEEAQGYLAFEGDDKNLAWVSGERLSKQLRNRRIQVVVLSACKSGLIGGSSAFNSVAGALIKRGIPVVIAMQFSVDTYGTAEIFIDDFYEALISGKPVAEAMAEARTSLLVQTDDYWYRPVLYMRVDPDNCEGRIFTTELSAEERRNTIFIEPLVAGTMCPDSEMYIERSADDKCLEYLRSPHAVTLFIQAPRQTGKSSLMRRVLDIAQKEYNKKFGIIDFAAVSREYFKSEDEFLVDFCSLISEALGIEEAVEKYWQGPRSNIRKVTRYLSQYIIPQINAPFILALDELEHMLTSPFRNNFFNMLRTWHNSRPYNDNFAKMTLLLSSSTESYLFTGSSFNVAEHISLDDFRLEEVHELNKRHKFPLNEEQVNDLMNFIGGHPYLTRLAFYLLAAEKTDIETLLAQAGKIGGPFDDYLTRSFYPVRKNPESESELKQALIRIHRYGNYEENQVFYQLKGLGLIKRIGKKVVVRNALYARYIEEYLNG